MKPTRPAPASAIGTRRHGREAALQMLYLNDLSRKPLDEIPEPVWSALPMTDKSRAFAAHLAYGVVSKQEAIDAALQRVAENWELHRMAAIDRCLLRLSAFELLYDLETPVNVVINEAVEIAKRFSTADSGKFVNGILDKLKSERPSSA